MPVSTTTPNKKAKITHGSKPSDQAVAKRPSNTMADFADSTLALVSVPNATAGTLQDHDNRLKEVNECNTRQAKGALAVQTFCFTALQQPDIKFGIDEVKDMEARANASLAKFRIYASEFIQEILPMMITNVSNIENQTNLTAVVPTVLPEGSTKEQWVEILQAIKDQADQYEKHATDTGNRLDKFSINVAEETGTFQAISTDLNDRVSGDGKILDSLRNEISQIDHSKGQLIEGIVGASLGALAGGLMIAVGTVGEVFTAGASTALIVTGGLFVVGGGTADGILGKNYADLNDKENDDIRKETRLSNEVQHLEAVAPVFQNMLQQARIASREAHSMAVAWRELGTSMETLSNNLESGIMNTGALRSFFLTTANQTVGTINTDISRVKDLLVGVKLVVGQNGEKLTDVVARETKPSSMQLAFFAQEAVEQAPRMVSADEVITLNKQIASSGVMMQAYALSIIQQGDINFGGEIKDDMKVNDLSDKFNKALMSARSHAKEYIENVEDLLIRNISNVESYFNLQQSVSLVLSPNTPTETWIEVIAKLSEISQDYLSRSEALLRALKSVKTGFENDATTVSSLTTDLNNHVNGDEGSLKTLQKQIDDLNKKINGAIKESTDSAFGIVGGVILVEVGVGIEILSEGEASEKAGGFMASGFEVIAQNADGYNLDTAALDAATKERNHLIRNQVSLKSGVVAAAAVGKSFDAASDALSRGIHAAESMTNSWNQLIAGLNRLSSSIQSGKTTPGEVQRIFIEAAANDVNKILRVVQLIKDQLVGVQVISDPKVSVHPNLKFQNLLAVPAADASEPSTLTGRVRSIQRVMTENPQNQSVASVKKAVDETCRLASALSSQASQFVPVAEADMVSATNQCKPESMGELQATLHKLKMEVAGMNSATKSTTEDVNQYEQQIITFSRNVQGQRDSLRTQQESLSKELQKAQDDLQHAKNQRNRSRILNILDSLAGCLIINPMSAEIAYQDVLLNTQEIERQLTRKEQELTAANKLSLGMHSLVNVLGSLPNSLNIVSADLSQITTDVNSGGPIAMTKIRLSAASHMLNSFKSDSA